MVEHHIWLVGQVIDKAAQLPDATLDAPIDLSADDDEQSLRSLLSRLIGQMDMWNCAVANRPRCSPSRPRYERGMSAGVSGRGEPRILYGLCDWVRSDHETPRRLRDVVARRLAGSRAAASAAAA